MISPLSAFAIAIASRVLPTAVAPKITSSGLPAKGVFRVLDEGVFATRECHRNHINPP